MAFIVFHCFPILSLSDTVAIFDQFWGIDGYRKFPDTHVAEHPRIQLDPFKSMLQTAEFSLVGSEAGHTFALIIDAPEMCPLPQKNTTTRRRHAPACLVWNIHCPEDVYGTYVFMIYDIDIYYISNI